MLVFCCCCSSVIPPPSTEWACVFQNPAPSFTLLCWRSSRATSTGGAFAVYIDAFSPSSARAGVVDLLPQDHSVDTRYVSFFFWTSRAMIAQLCKICKAPKVVTFVNVRIAVGWWFPSKKKLRYHATPSNRTIPWRRLVTQRRNQSNHSNQPLIEPP